MRLVITSWLAGLLLAWPAVAAPAAARPEVIVAEGRLRGTREGDLNIFRNIPYALPPVGERRWRPPEPPERWTGTREAVAFGPRCVQPPLPPESLYYSRIEAMSEDCLSLNVWAPANARGAPVIVWIHGGSLRIGGAPSRSMTVPLMRGAGSSSCRSITGSACSAGWPIRN